jgi:N-acetylmuramic acid 6-phosphate (MurNAc-6-P) etherase
VLRSAEGRVKTAIVMARLGIDREEAERRIAASDGRLRPLVGDPPPMDAP